MAQSEWPSQKDPIPSNAAEFVLPCAFSPMLGTAALPSGKENGLTCTIQVNGEG